MTHLTTPEHIRSSLPCYRATREPYELQCVISCAFVAGRLLLSNSAQIDLGNRWTLSGTIPGASRGRNHDNSPFLSPFLNPTKLVGGERETKRFQRA